MSGTTTGASGVVIVAAFVHSFPNLSSTSPWVTLPYSIVYSYNFVNHYFKIIIAATGHDAYDERSTNTNASISTTNSYIENSASSSDTSSIESSQ